MRQVASAVLLALGACGTGEPAPLHEVEGPPAERAVFSTDAPPAPIDEGERGAAPTSDYLWVNGYWTRRRDHWVWVHGVWAERPRPDLAWEDGHWDSLPSGYVRIPGRWH